MLTNLSLDNFKSISTSDPIFLRNFSIFCGANSSGKSSLIQAILMLSQTFSSRYDFDEIVLNGHLVRLGAFGDIRAHKSSRNTIDIEFCIETSKIRRDSSNIIQYKCTFGQRPELSTQADDDYHPVILNAEIRVFDVAGHVLQYLKISRAPHSIFNSESIEINADVRFRVEAVQSDEISNLITDFPDFEIIGLVSSSFAPYVLQIEYNYSKKMTPHFVSLATGNAAHMKSSIDDEKNQLRTLIPHGFFVALKAFIDMEHEEFKVSLESGPLSQMLVKLTGQTDQAVDDFLRMLMGSKLDSTILDRFLVDSAPVSIVEWLGFLNSLDASNKKRLTELMDKKRAELEAAWGAGVSPELRKTSVTLHSFQNISNYLTTYFSRSVKYLGPLRTEPQPVYSSLGHSDPRSVGLKGEFTAAVLHINKQREVTYPSPSDAHGAKFSFARKRSSLNVACREWLSYLGVISDYQTRDKGKLGYEIYVKIDPSDRWQDLTHVGVGVSQVLPIILMFLLSEPGDLLIFEQPELHLHPKVQSRLCDFFCAMAELGRQSIIETHSEYLINRLRLRIVQDPENSLEKTSSVFFVTKAAGRSNFDNIAINEYGAILEWPAEFFDQTDREVENILLEASRKRKQKKVQ